MKMPWHTLRLFNVHVFTNATLVRTENALSHYEQKCCFCQCVWTQVYTNKANSSVFKICQMWDYLVIFLLGMRLISSVDHFEHFQICLEWESHITSLPLVKSHSLAQKVTRDSDNGVVWEHMYCSNWWKATFLLNVKQWLFVTMDEFMVFKQGSYEDTLLHFELEWGLSPV